MRLRLASLVLLGILYVGPRLPFLDRPLMGEEGVFADLIVKHARPDRQGLMGRIGGEELRLPLQHPLGLYESLAVLGSMSERPWRALLGEAWHPTWVLRLMAGFFQAAVWGLLVFWLAPGLLRRPAVAGLLFLLMSAPLALGGSVYLQTDPTNGTLTAGLFSLALAWAFGGGAAGHRGWALPLAAFFLGAVGKQEWSLGLGGGLGLAWAWGRLSREAEPDEGRLLLAGLAGLALGNALSWAAQPRDYMDGLKLMLGLGAGHNVLSGSKLTWLGGIYYRFNFLLALGLLWLVLAWRWWGALGRERAGLRWALSISLGLGMPFLLMAWGRDPRYFLPAYMVAAPFLVHHAIHSVRGPRPAKLAWALGGLLALHSLWFWQDAWRGGYCITERPYQSYDGYRRQLEPMEREARERACVAALPTGLYWDRVDIDWVGDSMGPEDLKRYAAAAGRPPCRP